MFAGYMSGGQLMLTSDIENFPGYPKGIGGPEMMMELREQAERFGLEVHDKNVDSVDLSTRPLPSRSKEKPIMPTPSSSAPAPNRSGLERKAKTRRKDAASAPVPPATGPSSAKKKSSWSAVVILRWRKPRS